MAEHSGAADDSYLADISLLLRQNIHLLGSKIERIRYTTDIIAGLVGPQTLDSKALEACDTLQELSSPTSAPRTASDQAAHPDHPVFEPLIVRAKDSEDQRPLLQEFKSFVIQ